MRRRFVLLPRRFRNNDCTECCSINEITRTPFIKRLEFLMLRLRLFFRFFQHHIVFACQLKNNFRGKSVLDSNFLIFSIMLLSTLCRTHSLKLNFVISLSIVPDTISSVTFL